LKLGFEISERTVSRYSPGCIAVMRLLNFGEPFWNHGELIVKMDFLTVITGNFRNLYGLFLIRHDRQEIIHLHVTEHQTDAWVVQQLGECKAWTTNI
jgi:hypothetical protein